MVASDRVSAFDHVLEPGIPGKGALLTELSLWWFGQFPDVPNHLDRAMATSRRVADRIMLVRKLEHVPDRVRRARLPLGQRLGRVPADAVVCGVPLPAGLADGDRLPEPIFTPAFKAPQGEHDENITFERTVELVGLSPSRLRFGMPRLEVFARASAIAEAKRHHPGRHQVRVGSNPAAGALTLGDEVLTSDSSRYWDAAAYATGDRTASFDKQIVRNWLLANWDKQGAPPTLPQEIVEQTAARYRELIDRLTA